MTVSVSLPDGDVEFLDACAASRRITSRAAVLHKAVRLLRVSGFLGACEQTRTSGRHGQGQPVRCTPWLMRKSLPTRPT